MWIIRCHSCNYDFSSRFGLWNGSHCLNDKKLIDYAIQKTTRNR